MLKYALFLFSAVAFSQVPAPPACLSGPVTQGSVTVTCTAIDNTAYGAASDSFASGYVFQVKATSADPDVIAVRIGVTLEQAQLDPKEPRTVNPPRWVFAAKTDGAFLYTFNLYPFFLSDGQSIKTPPFSITSVQVLELKASSAQKF